MVSLGRDLTRMTIPTLVQRAQQGYRMADLRGFSMPFILGATQETFEPLMIVDLLHTGQERSGVKALVRWFGIRRRLATSRASSRDRRHEHPASESLDDPRDFENWRSALRVTP
jgi:hypothetical protein